VEKKNGKKVRKKHGKKTEKQGRKKTHIKNRVGVLNYGGGGINGMWTLVDLPDHKSSGDFPCCEVARG